MKTVLNFNYFTTNLFFSFCQDYIGKLCSRSRFLKWLNQELIPGPCYLSRHHPGQTILYLILCYYLLPIAQHSIAQLSVDQHKHSILQRSIAQHNILQCSIAQHSTAQCSVAQHSIVQCCTVGYSRQQHHSVYDMNLTPTYMIVLL